MTHLSTETGPPSRGPGLAGVAALLSRPRLIAVSCMAAVTGAGWAYVLLAAMPGGWPGFAALVDAMCRAAPAPGTDTLETVAIVGAMWMAMTLAMMLPSAGPMILTYVEIAETAALKGVRIVSPHVLIAGYLAVWLGFAAAATLAQVGVMSLAVWPGIPELAQPASAALFVAAGLYQFSPLKQACLNACRSPFSFFFRNWTDRTAGVFRLGLRQGLYCVGCCWAMMLLMFAAGAMNALWMALLGLVMLVEKMTAFRDFSRIIGIAFTAAGLTIFAVWVWGIVA